MKVAKLESFNVNKTTLYWKNTPLRTFKTRKKSTARFKASKDRPIFLLWANAAGNFKLKQMPIYHSKNPRALKNDAKPTISMLYKWNTKAEMTAHLLTT